MRTVRSSCDRRPRLVRRVRLQSQRRPDALLCERWPPLGARRRYVGCRDPSPPGRRRTHRSRRPSCSPESPGCGVARSPSSMSPGPVRSPPAPTGSPSTSFADLVAQEARQPVGTPLRAGVEGPGGSAWSSARVAGLRVRGRPRPARRPAPAHPDDPPSRPGAPAPPSAAYLRTILRGLGEATGWSPKERATYLLRARGVHPRWSEHELLTLCDRQPSARRGLIEFVGLVAAGLVLVPRVASPGDPNSRYDLPEAVRRGPAPARSGWGRPSSPAADPQHRGVDAGRW